MGTAEGGWKESIRSFENGKGCESTSSSFVKMSMLEMCVGKVCFMLEMWSGF